MKQKTWIVEKGSEWDFICGGDSVLTEIAEFLDKNMISKKTDLTLHDNKIKVIIERFK